jgi:hypothetical protein
MTNKSNVTMSMELKITKSAISFIV